MTSRCIQTLQQLIELEEAEAKEESAEAESEAESCSQATNEQES